MAVDENGNQIPDAAPAAPKPLRDRKAVFDQGNVEATKAGAWSDQFKNDFDKEFGGGAFGQDFFNKNEETKNAPLRAQQQMSKDFDAQSGAMKDNAFQGVAGAERRRLAGDISGIRAGASSRGLLHSGMRQGAEAGARANSDISLANSRMGINNAVNEQSQKLKEAPIAGGLNVAGIENNIANQAMSQAISNMQNRQSSMSGLGSALGSAAGTYIAGNKKVT